MLDHVPLGRPANSDEIAVTVLFLADPENSYMNGHVLKVDGGWTAGYTRDFNGVLDKPRFDGLFPS